MAGGVAGGVAGPAGLPAAPGFYGKVPSHGDFVGRRLPPALRDSLDRWLQAALVQGRHDLAHAWLPTWASSPLWRFVIGPGVCDGLAWAGVMMPSADRVGRCFPLLVAAGAAPAPPLRDCLGRLDAWFAAIETLMLDSLEPGFSIERFDGALHTLAQTCLTNGARTAFPDTATIVSSGADWLPDLDGAAQAAATTWWSDGSASMGACILHSRGLPAPAGFASMLDGRWVERGWTPIAGGAGT